ncbi:response regulator, partial [Thalassococcus sp.]
MINGTDGSTDPVLSVLIADDHRLLGEAVANLLRSGAGYSVRLTGGLDETLVALADSTYDIILLDLKMPGMVGLASVKTVVEKSGDAKVV